MDSKPSVQSGTWADDVEAEEAEHGQAAMPADPALLPSYARGGLSPRDRGPLPTTLTGPTIPDNPPFKVHLANIAYDLEPDAVEHFFRGLAVTHIMITRHQDTGRAKGCFVEFKTREDLVAALAMEGQDLVRRPVRIQIAEPRQGGRDGPRGGGGGGYFERGGRDGPPRGGGGGYFERGGREGPPRGGGGGFFERGGRDGRDGPPRGGGDDFHGSFGGRRERDEFPDRRGGGGGRGGGGYSRFDDYEDAGQGGGRWNAPRDVPVVQPSSPRLRPKLVLQPRSQAGEDTGSAAAAADAQVKVNPFGQARPIDTAAKLRDMEEKEKEREKQFIEPKERKLEILKRKDGGEPVKEVGAAAVRTTAAGPPPAAPPPVASVAPWAGITPGRPPAAPAAAATPPAEGAVPGAPPAAKQPPAAPPPAENGRGSGERGRGHGREGRGRGRLERGRGGGGAVHPARLSERDPAAAVGAGGRGRGRSERGARGGDRGGRGGSARGGAGGDRGRGGSATVAVPAAAAAGAVAKLTLAPREEETAKTKVSNPFDILGEDE